MKKKINSNKMLSHFFFYIIFFYKVKKPFRIGCYDFYTYLVLPSEVHSDFEANPSVTSVLILSDFILS